MTMLRKIMLLTTLMFATGALIFAGLGDGGAVAGTATPNVAGTWEGTWSHRIGSGQITLRLAQEGTKVTGKQSVVGVVPLFGDQTGRQITLGEEIRDGHIEDSTLIFHVEARDTPAGQVNFTLTASGDSMTGTVCGHTCGTVKVKKAKL
jgi:hypothetical protein